MPKKVDSQERRKSIADALMRVAATRGLEAVSLRHVAAEAGVSTGMVQHYFASKDEMMVFALETISAGVEARLAARAEAAQTPRAMVRSILIEVLPLDRTRRLEANLGVAFHAYSVVRPEVAVDLRDNVRQMRDFIADQIRATNPGIDADLGATGLLALVEGLGLQILGGYFPPESAVGALDLHLDHLFGAD